MRLFGHPVHVMLVHFPVALWPAHTALHAAAGWLPPGVAAVAGYWLLVAATALGCLAAFCGALDLMELARAKDEHGFRSGAVHAVVNGVVLAGFTVIAAFEYRDYPAIAHGAGGLAAEVALLIAMVVGNYFGAKVIWDRR
jgi:uncharacterized membrane protein